MCCDHQQPHAACLHRRQGLREDLGHQPARQQKPHIPAGLPGEDPRAVGISCSWHRKAGSLGQGEPPIHLAWLNPALVGE